MGMTEYDVCGNSGATLVATRFTPAGPALLIHLPKQRERTILPRKCLGSLAKHSLIYGFGAWAVTCDQARFILSSVSQPIGPPTFCGLQPEPLVWSFEIMPKNNISSRTNAMLFVLGSTRPRSTPVAGPEDSQAHLGRTPLATATGRLSISHCFHDVIEFWIQWIQWSKMLKFQSQNHWEFFLPSQLGFHWSVQTWIILDLLLSLGSIGWSSCDERLPTAENGLKTHKDLLKRLSNHLLLLLDHLLQPSKSPCGKLHWV